MGLSARAGSGIESVSISEAWPKEGVEGVKPTSTGRTVERTDEPSPIAERDSPACYDVFIEPDWLRSIQGGVFYYPAAGADLDEPVAVLHEYIDTFWFCDIERPEKKLSVLTGPSLKYCLTERDTSGPVDAKIRMRSDDSGAMYRYLEPSLITEIYKNENGRHISILRRRGFGQIGLVKEFSRHSISVFMHRGDSQGEGGSNAYFLANKRASYPPCANLFSTLSERLADRALIISDGSNSRFSWVRRFHLPDRVSGKEAYAYHASKPGRQFGGFSWRCVGWLSQKYGPTLVWGLERHH
jgi:hypothetical protein